MTTTDRPNGRSGGGRTALLAAGFIVALLLSGAGEAGACPVCYGDSSGSVIDGAKMSVAFLGALVYGVMAGGAALVVAVRRRAGSTASNDDDPRHGMRLVRDDPPPAEDD